MQHIYPESAAAATGAAPSAQKQAADAAEETSGKVCSRCGQMYPLSHYLKRTGRKSSRSRRRGTCRDCRKQLKCAAELTVSVDSTPMIEPAVEQRTDASALRQSVGQSFEQSVATATEPTSDITESRSRSGARQTRSKLAADHPAQSGIVTARPVRNLPSIEANDIRGHGLDLSILRPTRRGIVHMRGRTDKGRRWHQETDLDTAVTLVKEYAAVVVNRHTVRRLYSNRAFRKYILERDRYTCYFCGGYGDTIDHLLPRARGGHTTPLNCVCACNLCNQAKADHDLHHFIQPVDEQ